MRYMYVSGEFQSTQMHYFAQVTSFLLRIHESGASGRLSLRNEKHFGIVHLYFREALLVHVAGGKAGGGIAVLRDLLTWTQAQVRFDWNVVGAYQYISYQEAELFSRWLSLLEVRAVDYGVAPALVDGLEDRISPHLLRQTSPLPAITLPLPVPTPLPGATASRLSSILSTSPAPQPAASLSSHSCQDWQIGQSLPETPSYFDAQAAPRSTGEEQAREEEPSPELHGHMRQLTGVMQAVGRVTRKMASIKLSHRAHS